MGDLHGKGYWVLALVQLVHMHSGQCRVAMLFPHMRSYLQMSSGSSTGGGGGRKGRDRLQSNLK